jgi:hypothetical protein
LNLESICKLIKSQPTAIQTTLSNTTVAMLLVMKSLHDNPQAGFISLMMNETLIPESCNVQAKLSFLQEMKDDAKTLENVQRTKEN